MDEVGGKGILFYDTLLEYYLGIDPTTLPDEVWAMKLYYLREIRQQEQASNQIKR